MPSRSVKIALYDFSTLIKRHGGKQLPRSSQEVVFVLPVPLPRHYKGPPVSIEVFSSIAASDGWSRNRAQDAIKLLLRVPGREQALASKKVYRTKNWQQNLEKAITALRNRISLDYLCKRGHPLIVRENRRTQIPFWGGVHYPDCRQTRPFR